MTRQTKTRSKYDLNAWELMELYPTVVMIVSNKNGQISTIMPASKITFMPCELAADSRDFYEIIGFETWLKGFSLHHKVKCKTFDDVKEFYKKGGALLW